MSATATLNARVDVADKERFAATASALGISPSAAVNVFVRKFNEVGGVPLRRAALPRALRLRGGGLRFRRCRGKGCDMTTSHRDLAKKKPGHPGK